MTASRPKTASAPSPVGAGGKLAASSHPPVAGGAASTPLAPGPCAAVEGGAGAGSRRHRKPPLTGLALMADRMPENGGKGSLDYAVRQLLKGHPQIRRQHNSDSRRAHEGFPDWVLAGAGGMLVWELKREALSPTPEQQAWLDDFTAAGIPAGCRRPSDLLSGRIARELAALAGMGGPQ